jgi:transposase-like protein
MPKRRRRFFTPQFKAQVVLEVFSGQRNAVVLASPGRRGER